MTQKITAAVVSLSGLKLNNDEKRLLAEFQPLGICLFSRNIQNKIQLKNLTAEIRENCGREDIIIAADQEGGRVRRLTEPDFRSYASQYVLGKTAETFGTAVAEKAVSAHALLISQDLKECGINMNFAPVLDLAFTQTSPVLKSRCFGNDEKLTAAYGKIMIDEYIRNGICPCIKHMPGHGRVTVDPHLGLPVLNYSLQELEKDFYPFKKLNDCPAGMTAHVVIPEIDNQNPVTQSAMGIKELIRNRIGFDGLLISDAIDMKALPGSLEEKAVNCISAGCDAVCYCGGDAESAAAVCRKAGIMADKSMIRFEKIRNLFHNSCRNSNLDEVIREYETLTGKIEKYQDDYDATEVLNKMKHN